MPFSRLILASALVAATGIAVHAQQPTAVNLQLDVQPTASFMAGNMTRVAYVVANASRSTDRLFEFAVRSPVPVWRLEVPGPSTRYLGATREGAENVASWGWLDDMPGPGQASPVLAYEAIGLPGIVSYRALRYFGVRAVPSSDSTGAEQLRFDRAGREYTIGKTVGVVPLPLDLRPAALAGRLRRLTDEACQLGWIESATVCRTLRANAIPSARALRAYRRELVERRGKAVGEAAFALLEPNVSFLLGKL
jgi:hypothetical protein